MRATERNVIDQPAIGERLKRLREAMGLSLRELALRSGVSATMLSQVERDQTSPTLALAQRIATGLDLSLSQLVRLDEEPRVAIVRRTARRRTKRDGHTFEELTPPLPGERASVSMHTLRPGGSTGGPTDPPLHEAGSRETALVLSGELVLVLGSGRHALREGDAVTFDADLPHRFENPGDDETTFVAVVTAGLRRTT